MLFFPNEQTANDYRQVIMPKTPLDSISEFRRSTEVAPAVNILNKQTFNSDAPYPIHDFAFDRNMRATGEPIFIKSRYAPPVTRDGANLSFIVFRHQQAADFLNIHQERLEDGTLRFAAVPGSVVVYADGFTKQAVFDREVLKGFAEGLIVFSDEQTWLAEQKPLLEALNAENRRASKEAERRDAAERAIPDFAYLFD